MLLCCDGSLNSKNKTCTNSLTQGPFYSVTKWTSKSQAFGRRLVLEFHGCTKHLHHLHWNLHHFTSLIIFAKVPKPLNAHPRNGKLENSASAATCGSCKGLGTQVLRDVESLFRNLSAFAVTHPHRPTQTHTDPHRELYPALSYDILWHLCFWMRTWPGHGRMTRVVRCG